MSFNNSHHECASGASHVLGHQIELFVDVRGPGTRQLRDLGVPLQLELFSDFQQCLLETQIRSCILFVLVGDIQQTGC
jgi:hypothetical protein